MWAEGTDFAWWTLLFRIDIKTRDNCKQTSRTQVHLSERIEQIQPIFMKTKHINCVKNIKYKPGIVTSFSLALVIEPFLEVLEFTEPFCFFEVEANVAAWERARANSFKSRASSLPTTCSWAELSSKPSSHQSPAFETEQEFSSDGIVFWVEFLECTSSSHFWSRRALQLKYYHDTIQLFMQIRNSPT